MNCLSEKLKNIGLINSHEVIGNAVFSMDEVDCMYGKCNVCQIRNGPLKVESVALDNIIERA